jgi:hypothetical protein
MASLQQIESGIAAYLDSELMTKLPQDGFQKVIAGTAISLAIRKSSTIFNDVLNSSFVKMLDIVDESGDVDIDILKEELKKNMPETGVKAEFPMIGKMTFHKSDVDKLYTYIVSETIEK